MGCARPAVLCSSARARNPSPSTTCPSPPIPADDSDDDDDWEKADLSIDKKEEKEVWSDEEGHDAHLKEEVVVKPAEPTKPAAPKPKSKLEQKIEEREKREAAEAEKREAIAGGVPPEALRADGSVDEVLAEKIRRQKLEEASDMAAAAETFASPKPDAPAVRPQPRNPDDTVGNADPKTDKEFEHLAKLMNDKLSQYQGKKGHLVCLKALLRAATEKMSTEDTKALSSFVSVISNDKLAADRNKDKAKVKASKAKSKYADRAAAARSDHDLDDIGGGGGSGWSGGGGGRDDDYDFM